jgi:histidinol dehydrogenase
MLPILDMNTVNGRKGFTRRLDHLRASATTSGEAARTVSKIIQDVARGGDEAVVRYMRKWTDPAFSTRRIAVAPSELAVALRGLEKKMRRVLDASIAHVREYQKHIKPREPKPVVIDGATLGLRFTPVRSVGLAVPGGKAAYPSSVIMLAVPAIVAGVDPEGISVVTPPPTRTGTQSVGDISPLVLATCALLGIRRVYRIGGAQAIAALAFGTKTVQPVDMIVGPGNVFTQLAKQQLAGRVGIDGFYGPSEIVTIADGSADPARVAADLIAQAEHDPGRCFLVAWSRGVIDAVNQEIQKQTISRKRREAVARSLREWSAAVLVKNEAAAVESADTLAGEHVNLAVRKPEAWLKRTRNGGEFFLGDQTPVAAGDYFAGPSHCLPTGTTARFASGVSVYTFLKRSGTVGYKKGMSRKTIDAIAAFAEAEGLDGHAASARVRRKTR